MNTSKHHCVRHCRLTDLESLGLGQFEFNVKGTLRGRKFRHKISGKRMCFTLYSKSAGSMIPASLSMNFPTSQPKNTGVPALIILEKKIIKMKFRKRERAPSRQ